jgi:DNA-binding transcriptional MocR family regulator
MPTQRDLADQLGVTVGTVSRGYAAAARRGLLSGEVGRGTFVKGSTDEPAPSAAIDLARNHPPLSPMGPEIVLLRDTLRAFAEGAELHRSLLYAPDGGHPHHREAGARWIRTAGLEATPENTLVCGGSQHALTIAFSALLGPGDRLGCEALTYPGTKAAAALLRLSLEGLAIDDHGLKPGAFEDACRRGLKVLYCAPTIHNPTASVMPVARREEIARIARAHDVVIVEDDVHALLPDSPFPPIASFAPERTLFVASTSKTLAPGMRIAFLKVPMGYVARMVSGIRATTWGAPPLMAEVVTRWIDSGAAEEIVMAKRREAKTRQEIAAQALAGYTYAAHPQAYHLWLRLPEPWRSDTFVPEAQRQGVLVTPASVFSVERDPLPHAVRVCLGGARSHEALRRGLELLRRALASEPDAQDAVV